MPGFLRSILIMLGVTVFSFLAVSTWYWTQLRQPAPEVTHLLRRTMPTVEQLLERHEDAKVSALLDKLPFQVVVADATGQPLTSNLATTQAERQASAQRALSNRLLDKSLDSPTGLLTFYYQPPSDFMDAQLLFPLFFSLLLGLIATLWDFLQRIHEVDQTDALLALSHLPGVAHPHEHDYDDKPSSAGEDLRSRIEELEQKNKTLNAALLKAKQWVAAAPEESSEGRVSSQQVARLESRLHEQEQKTQMAQQSENRLRQQKIELETQLEAAKKQALERENEAKVLRTDHQKQEAEITRLHQDSQRQQRDLELAQSRLNELESQTTQLHEAWQEISSLRSNQDELLNREASWKKEKQRVLALMHEKEEALTEARERLKQSRQKVHELSVAYKKQLELAQNLPEDLGDARRILDGLIEDKDQIEHENVQLQLEVADRNSEVARLRKELEVRAQRLQEAQKLIEDLSGELNKHERELNLLGETLSDKLLDLDRLKDLHDDKVQVLEATSIERDQLRMRLDELESEVQHLRQDQGSLIYERDQLQDKLSNIDVGAYELEIEQLRQALQLTGQQQQRRAQAIEQLKTKLKEGEDLYARLKRHSESQERDIRSLQQEIGVHHSEIQLLQSKLAQHENPESDHFQMSPLTGWSLPKE